MVEDPAASTSGGSRMGACLIVSPPVAVLCNFFVERFVAGFTAGAVK